MEYVKTNKAMGVWDCKELKILGEWRLYGIQLEKFNKEGIATISTFPIVKFKDVPIQQDKKGKFVTVWGFKWHFNDISWLE